MSITKDELPQEPPQITPEQPPENSDTTKSPKQPETAGPEQELDTTKNEVQTTADLAGGTDELIVKAGEIPEIDQVSLRDIKREASALEKKFLELQTELASINAELAATIIIPKIESKEQNDDASLESAEIVKNQKEFSQAMESIEEINVIIDSINELLETLKTENVDLESADLAKLVKLAKQLIQKAGALDKQLIKIGLQLFPEKEEKPEEEKKEAQPDQPDMLDDEDDLYEPTNDQNSALTATAAQTKNTQATDNGTKPTAVAKFSERELNDRLDALTKTKLNFRQGNKIVEQIRPLLADEKTRKQTIDLLGSKLEKLDEIKGDPWNPRPKTPISGNKEGATRSMIELFEGLTAVGNEINIGGGAKKETKDYLDRAFMAMGIALENCGDEPPKPGITDFRQFTTDWVRPAFIQHSKLGGDRRVRKNISKLLEQKMMPKEKKGPQAPLSKEDVLSQLKAYL